MVNGKPVMTKISTRSSPKAPSVSSVTNVDTDEEAHLILPRMLNFHGNSRVPPAARWCHLPRECRWFIGDQVDKRSAQQREVERADEPFGHAVLLEPGRQRFLGGTGF